MKNKGFTLIEVLISIGTIILLSALILPNYKKGGEQFALERSVYKLSQDLRRAQEMAMSAKECEICGGGVPPGYGIFIKEDESQYILYADTHPAPGGNEFYAADTIVETIEMEQGVRVLDIKMDDTGNPPDVSINFSPPDPKIKIKYPSGPEGSDLEIILCLISDSTKIKTIKINKVGRIEIE